MNPFIFDPSKNILTQIKENSRQVYPYVLKYDAEVDCQQLIYQMEDGYYYVGPQELSVIITPIQKSKSLPEHISYQDLIKLLKNLGLL